MKQAALLLALVITGPALAADIVVAPTGAHAAIDTKLSNDTIRELLKGSKKAKIAAVEAVKAAPERYAPPVFYAMSHVLFERGDKDDAAFWFYAGQLRARFDANRCADSSARQAVSVLNQEFGAPINKYTFKDIPKLKALVPRVIDWDRKTPHSYDHRWINLHGMSAMLSGLAPGAGGASPLSLPESEWEAIAERTRIEYFEGFEEALATMDMGEQRFRVKTTSITYVSKYGIKIKVPADPATFKSIGGSYGMDKDAIYYIDDKVSGADRETFKVLGDSVARDQAHIYYRDGICDKCAPASFRRIAEDVYSDANAVYTDFISWERISGADAATFTVLNNWYAKDKDRVFLSGDEIPGADAATFKVGTRGPCESCGEDADRCYWFENPVDCGKGGHWGGDFPSGTYRVPLGSAVVVVSPNIVVEEDPPLQRVIGGDLIVPSGNRSLRVRCEDYSKKPPQVRRTQLEIQVEVGHIYRVSAHDNDKCDVFVEHPAFLLGQADRPQVQILEAAQPVPRRYTSRKLTAGALRLSLVCREVTRSKIYDVPLELSFTFEPGVIYELRGQMDASRSHCTVSPVKFGTEGAAK